MRGQQRRSVKRWAKRWRRDGWRRGRSAAMVQVQGLLLLPPLLPPSLPPLVVVVVLVVRWDSRRCSSSRCSRRLERWRRQEQQWHLLLRLSRSPLPPQRPLRLQPQRPPPAPRHHQALQHRKHVRIHCWPCSPYDTFCCALLSTCADAAAGFVRRLCQYFGFPVPHFIATGTYIDELKRRFGPTSTT